MSAGMELKANIFLNIGLQGCFKPLRWAGDRLLAREPYLQGHGLETWPHIFPPKKQSDFSSSELHKQELERCQAYNEGTTVTHYN